MIAREEATLDTQREPRFSLADKSPFGVLIGGQSGQITYMNAALRTMLGFGAEEVAQLSWLRLTPPEFAARDAQAIEEIRRTGTCAPYEKAYIAKDGRHIPVLVGASVLERAANDSLLVATYITDLTLLRQTELALQQSEAQLQFALAAAQMGTWSLDLRTNEVARSSFTDVAFGFPPTDERRTADAYFARIHPADRVAAETAITASIAGDGEHAVDYRVVQPDGSVRWLASRGQVIRDGAGQPVQLSGALADITRRQQAEAEQSRLYAAEQRARAQADEARALLDTLFNSAPIGTAFVDRELRYVRINTVLARMNNLPAEAHLGRRMSELFPGPGAVFEGYWRTVIATGEPILNVELSAIVRGKQRHSLASYYPVRAHDGLTLGVGILVLNISDRKRSENTSAILAATSTALTTSLDERALLADVTRGVVPAFADLCITWLVADDGAIEQVEIAHALPEKAALVRALHGRYPPDLSTLTGLAAVLRTGVAELVPSADPLALNVVGADAALHELVAQITPRSLLTVALRVRDRVLGAMQFVITESERRFDADDLTLAEEIARRCALALDNAWLYEAERAARAAAERAAERIQRLQLVTAALAGALTVEQVGRVLVEQSIAALGAYAGAFMMLDDEGAALDMIYSAGYTAEFIRPFQRVPLTGNAPLVEAVRTGELVVVDSPATWDARYTSVSGMVKNSATVATIALPLLVASAAIGGLALSFRTSLVFNAEERALLLTLARQCAQALERARLYDMERQARRLAEQANARITRLQTVTVALSQPLTVREVAEVVNMQGGAALQAQAGFVALLDRASERFRLAHAHGFAPADVQPWQDFALDAATPASDAARSGAPVLIGSTAELLARYPQLGATLWTGVAACAAIPLRVDDHLLGVILLAFGSARVFSADEIAFMHTLGRQCAIALERARLYEAEQQTSARQAFLAQTSRVLAETLDYAVTLQAIAQLTVPTIADFCTIHMVAPDGAIRQLAVAHRDPACAAQLEELERRYPMHHDEQQGLPAVIRTRTPILEPDLPQAMLRDFARSADQLALLQQLDMRSYLCLPLVARDRTLGALSLFTVGGGRRYGVDDLLLAQDLAQRCALAIDNALLYREAREAVQTRDTFLSIAAHELKTPLTSLMGNAQLLQRRLLREGVGGERTTRALQVIVEQARRLNKLIADMLDLSRLELGQLSIAREQVDLAALTRQIVDEVQPTLSNHHLALTVADEPLVVVGDALRLEQVLQNLISNGVKYSPRGGEVRVRLARDDGAARVAISDVGIGIPAEALPQLFQRFYRAPNVSAEQISGVGVGLFVVREIVELHGGTIAVESSEGVGSTFTVVLPLVG